MNRPTTALAEIAPPHAERRPTETTVHGVTLIDEYAWLRAENWQDVMRDPTLLAADIRAHLEAENAYTDAMLAGTTGLQEQLFAEMKARIKEDDSTVPAPDGPFDYYSTFVTGGQYPRLCRRPRGGGGRRADLVGPAGCGKALGIAPARCPLRPIYIWATADDGSLT